MQHGIKRHHLSEEAKRNKRNNEITKINYYRKLNDLVLTNYRNNVFNEQAFKDTTQLLALNPQYYTIWNYRRQILKKFYEVSLALDEYCALYEKELMFTMVQLKQFPKVYCIWNYRRWLLDTHPKPNWEFELKIVNQLLDKDGRNFHGWHYRRYIIESIETATHTSLAMKEFEFTTAMINKDFSNYSAWHNRSKLIPKLFELKTFTDGLQVLNAELELLQNAMYIDSSDQSVWIYLRWLLTDELFLSLISHDEYSSILSKQLSIVKELNQLEKEDNKGVDNSWCLKMIIFIESLMDRAAGEDSHSGEIADSLTKLIEIDPLRKNRFIEQLHKLERST